MGDVNKGAYLPKQEGVSGEEESKEADEVLLDPKFDWYQNVTTVFVSFRIKKGDLRNLVEVEYGKDNVVITYKEVILANLYLSNLIVPPQCDYSASTKKLELRLRKATENVNWP